MSVIGAHCQVCEEDLNDSVWACQVRQAAAHILANLHIPSSTIITGWHEGKLYRVEARQDAGKNILLFVAGIFAACAWNVSNR